QLEALLLVVQGVTGRVHRHPKGRVRDDFRRVAVLHRHLHDAVRVQGNFGGARVAGGRQAAVRVGDAAGGAVDVLDGHAFLELHRLHRYRGLHAARAAFEVVAGGVRVPHVDVVRTGDDDRVAVHAGREAVVGQPAAQKILRVIFRAEPVQPREGSLAPGADGLDEN